MSHKATTGKEGMAKVDLDFEPLFLVLDISLSPPPAVTAVAKLPLVANPGKEVHVELCPHIASH